MGLPKIHKIWWSRLPLIAVNLMSPVDGSRIARIFLTVTGHATNAATARRNHREPAANASIRLAEEVFAAEDAATAADGGN